MDDIKRLDYARRIESSLYDASMALPYKVGKEEGRDEGIEIGIKKGATDMQRQIANSLKAAGFDLDAIMKHTGLKKEELVE